MSSPVRARAVLLAMAMAAAGCSTDYGNEASYARLANLAPGPASDLIDFCAADSGTVDFVGPILQFTPTTTDPGGVGLSYGMVSKYLFSPAGSYSFRIVEYGSGSCAVGLVPDLVVRLAPGGTATIALVGLAGPATTWPLQATSLVDEWAQDPVNAKVRFVNASPGLPATDIGLVPTGSFAPVLTDLGWLEIAAPSTSPPVDANGFATVSVGGRTSLVVVTTCETSAPYSPATCEEWPLPPDVATTFVAGSVTSGFLVGVPGDATYPSALLWCADRLGPDDYTNLSQCTMVP
jgi:hypothetical protein